MLGVSVGYAVFPDEGWTPEHLLARADAAEIDVKRRKRAPSADAEARGLAELRRRGPRGPRARG